MSTQQQNRGTTMVSIPGPMVEFLDREDNSDMASEALTEALAKGRVGNAPKGYGVPIAATREIVENLREIAEAAMGAQSTQDDPLDPNLKAGARRFLARTEPGLLSFEGDQRTAGDKPITAEAPRTGDDPEQEQAEEIEREEDAEEAGQQQEEQPAQPESPAEQAADAARDAADAAQAAAEAAQRTE
jgi:hypothetical protein